MTHEPLRLLEDPLVPDAERALLELGRSQSAVEYDIQAGLTRFRAGLRALPLAGAVAATASGAKATGTVAKAGLLAKVSMKTVLIIGAPALSAAVGLATVDWRRSESVAVAPTPTVAPKVQRRAVLPTGAEPVARPRRDATTADAEIRKPVARARPLIARRAPPPPALPAPVSTSRPGDETPSRPVAVPTSMDNEPKRPRATQKAKPSGLADNAAEEIRALAQARKLFGRNPGAALGLLEAMKQAYPNGYFVEERRALTVLALARIGQSERARELASSFCSAYPNGPFTDKVRAAAGL